MRGLEGGEYYHLWILFLGCTVYVNSLCVQLMCTVYVYIAVYICVNSEESGSIYDYRALLKTVPHISSIKANLIYLTVVIFCTPAFCEYKIFHN